MLHKRRLSFLALLSVCAMGCQMDESARTAEAAEGMYAGCLYQAPEAIFRASSHFVSRHAFTLAKQESKEEVHFDNGTVLGIAQSGCDQRKMVLTFLMKGQEDHPDPMYWAVVATEQLNEIAAFSPEYLVFSAWADAIDARADEFRFGKAVALNEVFDAVITRQAGAEGVTLRIVLTEK